MLTTSITLHRKSKDGTSVTILSTSVQYQVSASPTDIPETWYDDIKNAIQTDSKPYLWSKTTVEYSDNNTTTTFSVSYKGKDGTSGTSFTPKGMADGYYSKATEIPAYSDEQNGKIYIVDDATNVTSPFIVPDAPYVAQYVLHNGKYVLFLVHAEFGDGYNVNGHLYVANDDKWVDFGEIQGAKGDQGDPGKDAVNINLSPSELVYNADKDGYISSTQFNNNTSQVSATMGGKAVSCITSIVSKDNCEAIFISSNVIKITKITTESVATGKYVPASAGGVKLKVTVDGTDYYSYLPFRVNTNTFVKTVLETDESFQRKYTEISNKYNTVSNELNGKASKDELREVSSSIEQTARRISLEVSSNAVGRRNLLVNSDFHNQESLYFSSDTRIECTTGKDGINCVHITSSSENGVYWDGTKSGGMSVVITKGKKYTFSCWVKSSSTSAQFWIRAYSTSDIANASIETDFYEAYDMHVSSPNTWELFTFTIDTSSAVTNYLAVIFCVPSASDAYICKPMMEEGDTYKGWSLSTEDYDYVGGNMLDNTLSLDKSGTLYEVNGKLTTAGFGESTSIYKSFAYELKGIVDSFSQLPTYGNVYNDTYYVRNDGTCYAYNGSKFEDVGNDYYYNILEWRKGKSGEFSPFGLEANKDYVFSFMAKGTGKITAYFYEPYTDVFVESSLGAIYTEVDGYADFQLTNEWRRYWVHWRPSDSLHKYILLRLNRSFKSDGSAPITDCYIAQPKLEDGATMTEFTERKTDLVDKASLKKAGIEITSDQVTLYGNKVQVKNPKENPSDGYDEAAMFQNGKLNAQFINAGEVVAKGIKTQELEAQHLNVTGNSRLGIFEIRTAEKDDRDQYTIGGDAIQYSGGYKFPDGETEAFGAGSFLMYKPMFVRQGSPDNSAYMRLGHQFTEWDDCNFSGGNNNYLFVGAAARYVCSGDTYSCERTLLPSYLKYYSEFKPSAYVYSVKTSLDDPAFAIKVVKPEGSSGERTAIQTNAAIRGVLAPNAISINDTRTIPNGIGVVICTNGSEMTLTLPVNPLEGQTLIIIQGSTSRVYIVPSGNAKIYCHGQMRDNTTKFYSGTIGQFNIFVYVRGAWQLQWMNYQP